MLTIDRPSFIRNKLVIAAVVFSVGFMGSLSVLRVFQPGLGQLSSGRQAATVPRTRTSSSGQTQPSSGNTNSGTEKGTDSANGTAGDVKPVASDPVDPPAPGYSVQTATPSPASGSGIIQVSGQVAPTGQSSPTDPAPSFTSTIAQSSTGSTSAPQPSVPSASSPTAPIPSLTQSLTDSSQVLLPSL